MSEEEGLVSLVLDPAVRGQAGEYACALENHLGANTSESVSIDILCKSTTGKGIKWASIFINGMDEHWRIGLERDGTVDFAIG